MPDRISPKEPRGSQGPRGFSFVFAGEKKTAESTEVAEETEIFFHVFFVSSAGES